MIVHWPAVIKAQGEIRTQFTHAIDVVPTVLDVLKIDMPTSINGVAQAPMEGVSFASTFEDTQAKLQREAQYFELAQLFEEFHQLSDLVIDERHVCSEHLHLVGKNFLLQCR